MKNVFRFVTIAVLLLVGVGIVDAGGMLDPKLQQKMQGSAGPFQVIVTFKDHADVTNLSALGVSYLALQTLPMAGAVLTRDQINTVLSWTNVESVYFNDQLSYFNHTSGEITGAHYVQATLGVKGKGKTILVLDSGIDATHPDLTFRDKVIENVKIVGDLGVTGTNAFVEGVINTDNTSGHGTHVSGTVAGTGTASATDERDPYYYRGVAPEASLVGLGAGETLLILHALIGFDYAIATRDRFGTSVITNSWGNSTSAYDPNNPISKASYEAYRKGIVVTFAAGNDGPGDNTMSTYAINPWVIGVAAGDKNKALADFSSRGEAGDPFEHPDITAPGVNITSTRAIGTPVGALGPVTDINHPQYTAYYHTISGTSMATPFVAGTTTLLLSANPQLSPDQVEEILMKTADPMPGYQFHQTGAGYINVRRAVETAMTTTGNRPQFLTGDTKWSSQGNWVIVEETDANLGYFGPWSTVTDSRASGGSYKVGSVKEKKSRTTQKPLLRVTFYGATIKLGYPTNDDGGTGEVFIDGVSRGTVNFYSSAKTWNVHSAYGGLSNTNHTLELKALKGKIYVDNLFVDGKVFPSGTQFVEETTSFTGSMGPSVQGIPETRLIPIDVPTNAIQINAELSWTGGVDLDLYLLDPNGNQVASSASLDNPEAFSYWVTKPGTYTYQIVGYTTVLANYTLNSTQVKAITSQPAAATASSFMPVAFGGKATQESDLLNSTLDVFQNYPNPFNPTTRITFSLPSEGYVVLRVFNILGKEMATLVQERRAAGTYNIRFNAQNFPSGMYFYRLEFSNGKGINLSKTNRMVLAK
ncbi:MAG: S8 family peptidase [Ignavibacteriales bacterium]|nr:S8 family peptidase [Ignavibacteriales bacterium]